MLVSSAELERFAARSVVYSGRMTPSKQAAIKSAPDKAPAVPAIKPDGKVLIWSSFTFGKPISFFAGRSPSRPLTFEVEMLPNQPGS